MGSQGLEPWTHGLRVRCSTNWANCPLLTDLNIIAYAQILQHAKSIFYIGSEFVELVDNQSLSTIFIHSASNIYPTIRGFIRIYLTNICLCYNNNMLACANL